jgi:hypothetical protein
MALVLLLLAVWLATNVALLALAAVLDRRAGAGGGRRGSASGPGHVVRMPHPR